MLVRLTEATGGPAQTPGQDNATLLQRVDVAVNGSTVLDGSLQLSKHLIVAGDALEGLVRVVLQEVGAQIQQLVRAERARNRPAHRIPIF